MSARTGQSELVQVLGVESHGVRLFREILTAQVEHDLMVQALIHHSVMAGAPGGDLEREVQGRPTAAAAHDEATKVVA